jgi:hypothetical protein
MRSKILVLTVTAALSASLPATALAAHSHPVTHAAHAATSRASQSTWHLVITPTAQRIVGTTYLEADKVSRHGMPFGLDVLTCPGAAQAGVAVAHCTLDLGTRGGTIHGPLRLTNTTGAVTGHVTGGTGRFAGATGTITGQGQKSGAALTIVLTSS